MGKYVSKFDSPLHRRLWLESAALIPLEASTAWIKDEALLESCRQFYNYVNDAYDDILKYPVENYIDPFDPVFGKRSDNGDVITDSMAFHRNIIQKFLKVKFFAENNFISIKNSDYDKLIKNLKNKFPSAKEIKGKYKIFFTFDDLFASLVRSGIIIKRFEDQTVIENEKYPEMFLAARLLYDAAEAFNKKTRRSPQCFIKMDFRAIENPFRKPELDDIFYPLTSDEREMTNELLNLAKQKKLRGKFITETGGGMTFGDFSFTYNNFHIMAFIWRASYGYKIKITLPEPETAEHDLLLKKINELENAENIKDFCLDNLYGCLFCSKSCMQNRAYKKKWIILGRPAPKLIASCWGFGLFFPPDEENLAITKTLIDMLTEIY